MTEEQITDLFRRYESGLCTPEEEAVINHWMDSRGRRQDPGWKETEQALFMDLLDQRVADATGIELLTDPQARDKNRRPSLMVFLSGSKKWAAAAAIIIVTATTGWLYLNNHQQRDRAIAMVKSKPLNDLLPGGEKAVLTLADGTTITLDSAANGAIARQGSMSVIKSKGGEIQYASSGGDAKGIIYNTMSTPRGGQYKLHLSDGTEVWLNAASSITYPTSFADSERVVTLTGEAYFEIAKNKFSPFLVKAGDMVVQALGTHFNINSYYNEGSMKTTLLEGSVRVSMNAVADHSSVSDRQKKTGWPDRNLPSIILKPGQQAEIKDSSTNIKLTKDADIDQVMAWKNGFFHFENADLPTVMRHLARWYDVDVEFEDNIPSIRFEGEMPMDAPASQVLRVLQKNNVHFRIEGKKIIVSP